MRKQHFFKHFSPLFFVKFSFFCFNERYFLCLHNQPYLEPGLLSLAWRRWGRERLILMWGSEHSKQEYWIFLFKWIIPKYWWNRKNCALFMHMWFRFFFYGGWFHTLTLLHLITFSIEACFYLELSLCKWEKMLKLRRMFFVNMV